MKKVLIDTDILVDHLRGVKRAKEVILKVKERKIVGYLSAITEAELLSGKECKKLDKKREIEELVGLFIKININNKIAKKAGEFKRNYQVPLIDSIIAATAFYQKAIIWTRNLKHYSKITEIKCERPTR